MAQQNLDHKYAQLFLECDALVKAGHIGAAAKLISRLSLVQVPRRFRQHLAKLCRRAGLTNQGLRLLQPIIRSELTLPLPASAGEKCEYAILLSRNGSVDEALNLLAQVDVIEAPEALPALAYCHMAKWDYSKVPALLEQFLSSSADPYTKLIARVNLASSYLALSQLDKAIELCTETAHLALEASAPRLAANCFEIRGQAYFWKVDFTSSRSDLKQATNLLGNTQSYDQLFIYKWQTVMQALEQKSVEPLIKFRLEAVQRRHWESVREADLFMVKVRFNQKLLDQVVFGTPLPAYRSRIHDLIGAAPSESFVFGAEGAPTLDLKTGAVVATNTVTELNAGKKIHRTILALVRDLYAPRNTGSLFSELYSGEFFDINSSSTRIRQLLKRTRQWLEEHSIAASIHHQDGTYRFSIDGAFAIKLYLQEFEGFVPAPMKKWSILKTSFPKNQPFSAKMACEKLRWSRSGFRQVAEAAIQAGELHRSGIGKSTLYLIPSALPATSCKSAA